jgi:mono/diheme cytochrome c family protein
MRTGNQLAIGVAAVSVLAAGLLGQGGRKVDFGRQIRPILSDNCFSCHGPDEKNRMANLRFDDRESAGRVIVPGKRNESKLFQRIAHADAKKKMPPMGSSRTLTKDQIELVGKWIDEGGEWKTHWSYEAPKRPELPAVGNAKWVRNAIDNFVLARLEKEGLKPAAEAYRVTLIRRLSLDLNGLPPKAEDVAAFVADKSPNAYERLVDRLLESPHYGERMAMMWLDLARYADTHGYHIDSHRDMWPWRDWVIASFNQNKPFDRFTVEQLAGDLLEKPTRDQLLATGFNRNHMINYEGGAIPDEYLVEYSMDRVETTSVVWMGMTMGCARCHDHKYDPISQKDFYRFFAFFHNVDEKGLDGKDGNAKPFLPLPDGVQEARMKELEQAIASREKQLPAKEVDAALAAWAKTADVADGPHDALAHYDLDGSFADVSGQYRHARVIEGNPSFVGGVAGQAIGFDGESQVDWGSFGAVDRGSRFGVSLWMRFGNKLAQTLLAKSADGKRGFWLEMEEGVSIGDLKRGSKLLVKMASGAGDGVEVRTRKYVVQNEWTHVAVSLDGSGKASGIAVYLDGVKADVDVVKDSLNGSFAADAPWSSGNRAVGKALRTTLDDVRIYGRELQAQEVRQLAVVAPVRGIVATQAAKRTKDQKDRLREYYLSEQAPENQRQLHAELKKLGQEKVRLEKEIVRRARPLCWRAGTTGTGKRR